MDGHNDVSPRPGEPDLCVRFSYNSIVFDYLACRTAAENLLGQWDNSHNPDVSLHVLADHIAVASRLPCETTWLTR